MNQETVISLQKAQVYQGTHQVLKDVDLEIKKGEFIYLIGKTGSGKSSLLKTLYGELPLKEGNGRIAEFELKKIKRKQVALLRRKIGIVFQDFQLLMDRTVDQNLLFVMRATGWKDRKKMKARAAELLDHVGLGGKGGKMPHQLSGGEQQRVAVARSLVNKPEIILADEPTGNLDPETSDEIMKLLEQISKEGTAILMATHDYKLIDRFPGRIIRCHDHIVEPDAPTSSTQDQLKTPIKINIKKSDVSDSTTQSQTVIEQKEEADDTSVKKEEVKKEENSDEGPENQGPRAIL